MINKKTNFERSIKPTTLYVNDEKNYPFTNGIDGY